MCHFSDVVVHVTDNEGNQFFVTNAGVSNVQRKTEEDAPLGSGEENGEVQERREEMAEETNNTSESKDNKEVTEEQEKGQTEAPEKEEVEADVPKQKEVIEYKQHAPRFFIVHSDGSGTELLRYQDLAEYIANAEDDLATAILMDPLADYPGVMGLTVLKPYLKNHSDKWMLDYAQASIIPPGLTSRDLKTLPAKEIKMDGPKFGTNVGQGLNIGSVIRNKPLPIALKCPEKLELRQIIQFRPVSEDLRTK